MEEPLTSGDGGQFGESKKGFGTRLDYSRPKYRDAWACILFLIHICVILGIGIYFWSSKYDDLTEGSSGGDNDNSGLEKLNFTGIVVSILAASGAGVLFGLLWLFILKKFAAVIIKSMLFLNIGLWAVVAVLGIIINEISLTVIGVIFCLFMCLYTWCVWSRIPFASALLKISSSITTKYQGTVIISFAVIILNVFWYFAWASAIVAYILWTTQCTTNPPYYYYETCTYNGNNFVVFLYMISFYWAIEVWRNISHTTTCGVAATWYFSEDARNPTCPAFKRTMTTSFGSVCFGSLIVGILSAIRAMLRNAKGNNALKCIALCLLACIENLMRYFNTYAFAQVAIYGSSYIEAAKATFELLKSELWKAIINDDLSGMALRCGAFLSLVVSAGVGYFVGYLFFHGVNPDSCAGVDPCSTWAILTAVIGGLIGFLLCLHILFVVRSSIVCLFVCFAEDPAALRNMHPTEYGWLTGVPTYGDKFRQIEGERTGV